MDSDRLHRRVGLALVACALTLVFLGQLVPVYTVDVFYHLAVGEWILDEGKVPATGLFSATRGEAPWVDCEWGFQVLATLVDRTAGILGLVLMSAVLVTGALALLAVALARRGVALWAVACAIALGGVAIAPLSASPQNISYLFFAAFLLGVTELRAGRRSARVLLPVLMVAWVNFHAGFIMGWVALALPLVTHGLARLRDHESDLPWRQFAVTLALTVAASFCNPYGWKQVVYPISYALDPALTSFNQEWQPTVLIHDWPLLLVITLGVAGFALARRRVRLDDLVLFLAFTVFALKGRRHTGLAAIALLHAAAPYAAPALAGWLRGRRPAMRPALVAPALLLVFAGLFVARGRLPSAHAFSYDSRVALPVAAANFIETQGLPGPIFNQYRWGAYLLHRFKPRAVAFVDGRNDLYGSEFMADYLRVLEGRRGFHEVLDRHQVPAVLLELSADNWRLLRLLLDAGWVCVHTSDEGGSGVLILVRPVPALRPWIEAFGRELVIPPPP